MEGNEAGDRVPIINEVLCFIQNKIDILDFDIIVQLCVENFDKATIDKAKEMLFDFCHNESDKTVKRGRTGEHKSDRNLQDIYNLLQEKGDSAPIFCARNLNILPPVTLKNVNVSNLLHTVIQLQTEVKLLTQASKVQKELTDNVLDRTKSLDVRVSQIETPNHGVKSVPERKASTVAPVVDGSAAPKF